MKTRHSPLVEGLLMVLCGVPLAASSWTNAAAAGVDPYDPTVGGVLPGGNDVQSYNLLTNANLFAQASNAGYGLFSDGGTARFGGGSFGLYATAYGQDNGDAGVYSTVAVADTLTANGYTIVIPITVDGTVDTPIKNSTYSTVGLHFGVGCTYTSNPQVLGTPCPGNFQTNFTAGGQFQQTITLTIPTTPGAPVYVEFSAGLNADVYTNQPPYVSGPQAPTAGETADFSHTGVFGPAEVLDQNGQLVSNGLVTSGLGFNYMDPTATTATAPEPATLWAVAAGIVLLSVFRGKRT